METANSDQAAGATCGLGDGELAERLLWMVR